MATVDLNVGVTIGSIAGNDRSLTFTSGGGAVTTLSLNRGSVEVLFNNAASLAVDRDGRATVTGSSLQIAQLDISATTAASTLSISSRGTGALTIGGISDASPIRTISAPRAGLSGTVNLSGVAVLQFLQINNAKISVGAGIPTGFSLITGGVGDSTLSSAVPIRTLQASAWNSSTPALRRSRPRQSPRWQSPVTFNRR